MQRIRIDFCCRVTTRNGMKPTCDRKMMKVACNHDDVIRWKHFPRYWPFVRGIHRSSVNSPYKGQWLGALMFTLICARINGWVNNREAGDLRRQGAHYDVIVLIFSHLHCKFFLNTRELCQPFECDIATKDRQSVALECKNLGYKWIFYEFRIFTKIGESDRRACGCMYILTHLYVVRSPMLPGISQRVPISPA